MGLREVLQARAAFQGRTAEVSCGELGVLTVEALPIREAEALSRGADAHRAVFYAACRELQAEGDAMHRAGRIYAPDGIMRFVSEEEAAAAARTVLEISGLLGAKAGELSEELPAEAADAGTDTEAPRGNTAEDTADAVPLEETAAETAVFAPREKQRAEIQNDQNDEALVAREYVPLQTGGRLPAESPAAGRQDTGTAESEPLPGEMQSFAGLAAERLRTSVERGEAAVLPAEEEGVDRWRTAAANLAYAERRTFRGDTYGTENPEEPGGTFRREQSPQRQTAPRRNSERSGEEERRPGLLRDDGEYFARQLLEGLRRAKWVRGE